MDQKLHLGYSPLTRKIYLGKQRGDEWVGERRDVTSEFLQVMLQKFKANTCQNITVDGELFRRIIVIDADSKIEIDGKEIKPVISTLYIDS